MAMEFTGDTFNVTSGILAFPDHYVAKAVTAQQNSELAVEVGNRKVVKAGTVWPSNDENAEGIVLNDMYVTNGDASGAVVIHGFIKGTALPEPVSEAAAAKLPMITILGYQGGKTAPKPLGQNEVPTVGASTKKVSELIGTDVAISYKGISGTVTGTLKKVDSWEEFTSGAHGYFFPVKLGEEFKGKPITCTGKHEKTATDLEWVLRVTEDGNDPTSFTFKCEDKEILKLDFSKATFEGKEG